MAEEKKKKILIVEDNKDNIDLLHYYLKPLNHEIFTVEDGKAALSAVEEHNPDIILLDIMLPEIDGFEVCETLKNDPRFSHVPIIMITALKELKDKIKSLEVGADDFITKPFENVELIARIKSLLKIKQYYDNLAEKNAQLQEQVEYVKKIDAFKDDLLKLIVHDLKNPLFVLQGNIQMMDMAVQNESFGNLSKYIYRIDRSSNQLQKMVLNLLDISKIREGSVSLKQEMVDINATLKNIIDKVQEYPENVEKQIETQYRQDLGGMVMDSSLIERMLDTLVNYACDNTEKNGTVFIKTDKNESEIIINVQDQGKKIPGDMREKVFDLYSQNQIKKDGYRLSRALGFVFCKLAVEAHKGKIELLENDSGGNKFQVILPRN